MCRTRCTHYWRCRILGTDVLLCSLYTCAHTHTHIHTEMPPAGLGRQCMCLLPLSAKLSPGQGYNEQACYLYTHTVVMSLLQSYSTSYIIFSSLTPQRNVRTPVLLHVLTWALLCFQHSDLISAIDDPECASELQLIWLCELIFVTLWKYENVWGRQGVRSRIRDWNVLN